MTVRYTVSPARKVELESEKREEHPRIARILPELRSRGCSCAEPLITTPGRYPMMKIKRLDLFNFRSASDITFDFNEKLNLFVGINGSGKSTILDALSICLSWLVRRIERDNEKGSPIPDASLRNGADRGWLDIDVISGNREYRWLLVQTAPGKPASGEAEDFAGTSELAGAIRNRYDEQTSWPVIAYYPITRIVGSTNPEVAHPDSVYNLDVYENALGGTANYQSFFEWFRLQDDILNERAQSRSKWMKQNKSWIKRRVTRLVDLLKKSMISDGDESQGKELQYLMKHLEKDGMLYEEPRFLFLELSHLTDMVSVRLRDKHRYVKMIHDLEFMFHKMASLSGQDATDDLIGEGGFTRSCWNAFFRGSPA